MSAAIVQKSTATAIYFECGEIFSATKPSETQHNPVNRMNGSSLQDVNSLDLCNTANSVEQKEKLEQPRGMDNTDQYRFHGALTRTISQPQPQLLQQQPDTNVATLVSTLIENLGSMNLHRKLERTQSEPLPQQVNTSRYKTELCRPFEEAGECKYGEKCQFAHGYHELRNLQRHPKYKTEYCRTFHSVGFCPYGPRCHFVHNADEARAMQQITQQPKLQTHHSNFTNCISAFPIVPQPATAPAGASKQQQHQVHHTQQQLQPQQPAVVNGGALVNHSLPLSPPLSMSTGSDRESPTGSLSLSPTSSMTSFPFSDQISPANSLFQTAFPYNNTPPESPNTPMSPVNTPPPTTNFIIGAVQAQPVTVLPVSPPQMFIKPVTIQGGPKQLLQKSSSSPIAIIRNVNNTTNNNNNNNNNNSNSNCNINNNGIKAAATKVNSVSVSSLNGAVDDARLPVFNRLSSAIDTYAITSNVAL